MGFLKWIAGFFLRPKASAEAPAPRVKIHPKTEPVTDTPAWLRVAFSEVGVKEYPGGAAHPSIVRYHQSTHLDSTMALSDETPWCSSFVNWCFEKVAINGTNSAWARSWLSWGTDLKYPRKGCVVVFSRGTSSGHVAFFLKEVGENILVIGGNQSNSVCEALYPKSRLLGYRWPNGVP